jgi:DNA-binding response OmpR family regulator
VAVIIEDDPDIRALISAVLRQSGFEVHTATGGLEGIETVRLQRPLVTTLDVSMPGIDGFETARRIRAFSDTHIMMVTARADEEHARRGREAGADDYITKPFRPRDLRARVEAVIGASD